jgi:hypothetical protein
VAYSFVHIELNRILDPVIRFLAFLAACRFLLASHAVICERDRVLALTQVAEESLLFGGFDLRHSTCLHISRPVISLVLLVQFVFPFLSQRGQVVNFVSFELLLVQLNSGL